MCQVRNPSWSPLLVNCTRDVAVSRHHRRLGRIADGVREGSGEETKATHSTESNAPNTGSPMKSYTSVSKRGPAINTSDHIQIVFYLVLPSPAKDTLFRIPLSLCIPLGFLSRGGRRKTKKREYFKAGEIQFIVLNFAKSESKTTLLQG